MRPATHLRFVNKAIAALVSAVEIYNKPSFPYREEAFCILGINAWELLIKAKLVKDAGNDTRALYVYETRTKADGTPSKKQYLKRNRSGNPMSISLTAAVGQLNKSGNALPGEIVANLSALIAIRDNSVHYVTPSSVLAQQAQGLASASVQNFVLLAKKWFSQDFSHSLHLVLPLSFLAPSREAASVVVSTDESNLIKHLAALSAQDKGKSEFFVAVKVALKMERTSLASASKVQISNDPDALHVTLSEHDIREKYPLDLAELCRRLKKRYQDFKQNAHFWAARAPLMKDERYVKSRYLDFGNPNSSRKDYYSPNILPQFDPHYTKR